VARRRAASCARCRFDQVAVLTRDVSQTHSLVTLHFEALVSGHHDWQHGAVLGAVKASSLRADRFAAAGLDRASAQHRGALGDGQTSATLQFAEF